MRAQDEMLMPNSHAMHESILLEGGGDTAGQDFKLEREELERVLGHPELSRAVSLVRFLNFICQKYFEDRTSEIREHSIAEEALGRKASTFDSQIDPIVRVTARALRKKLRGYYDTEGRNDPLEIVIPVGRYVPQFVPRPGNREILPREGVEVGLGEAGFVPEQVATAKFVPGSWSAARDVEAPMRAAEEVRKEPERAVSGVSGGPGVSGWLIVAIVMLPVVFGAGVLWGRHHETVTTSAAEMPQWGEPVWSDEFDGAAMQVPDSTNWTFDVGNQSWGNHEVETYCAPGPAITKGCDPRHPNAFLDGAGHLVLRAQRNIDGNWTSARITTRGLKSFKYGRIEARMKMPVGTGLWPAFWMLGANFDKVGWPAAGTVDVAENVGLTPRSNGLGPGMIRSSLHGPGYSGSDSLHRDYRLPNGERIDDGGFHTYGIIWSPGMIQFYVDDPSNVFFAQNMSDLPDGGEWVFDQPFYLVMNLAVGGDWAGDPDNSTRSPSEMVVDYVRVYKMKAAAPVLNWQAVQVRSGGMASSLLRLHGEKGSGRVYVSCTTEPATVGCALDASTVDFSDTGTRNDLVTISANTLTRAGNAAVKPGTYKLTLAATTVSGDRSQVTVPFEVTAAH